jgi:hypothetical protein
MLDIKTHHLSISVHMPVYVSSGPRAGGFKWKHNSSTGASVSLGKGPRIQTWQNIAELPYVERFMHHFWGNMLFPRCVIFEGVAGTGPPPKQSKTGLAHNSGWWWTAELSFRQRNSQAIPLILRGGRTDLVRHQTTSNNSKVLVDCSYVTSVLLVYC